MIRYETDTVIQIIGKMNYWFFESYCYISLQVRT